MNTKDCRSHPRFDAGEQAAQGWAGAPADGMGFGASALHQPTGVT